MKIKELLLREVLDSRGEPTLELGVRNEWGGVFMAQVPSGKSRGTREVRVHDYGKAKKTIEKTLSRALVGQTCGTTRHFDELLIALDGTPDKRRLGGNVTLGLSIAFARALAAEHDKELWQVLREEYFPKKSDGPPPLIFANLVNGGAHAANNLDIQEYMVVVEAGRRIRAGVKKLIKFYRELGRVLAPRVTGLLPIGDEGGYAPNFKNNFEPIAVLEKLIVRQHLAGEYAVALDVAASEFAQGKKYRFEGRVLSATDLRKRFMDYFAKAKLLVSIEDPFAENDTHGFRELMEYLPPHKLVVGDDFTTTNASAIAEAARENLLNGVIVKANQIGTLAETCAAIAIADHHGVKSIVSHRSGETADTFLVHIAKAANAYGVKIGAPIHERILKYNELIRLYE